MVGILQTNFAYSIEQHFFDIPVKELPPFKKLAIMGVSK
jgi:hypothetical protein